MKYKTRSEFSAAEKQSFQAPCQPPELRARIQLQAEYAQPFRELPAVGKEHVITQADGTMIYTVRPGARKGKRPREWKEMRLVAAQAKDSATPLYGATFGSVAETGRLWGHCT